MTSHFTALRKMYKFPLYLFPAQHKEHQVHEAYTECFDTQKAEWLVRLTCISTQEQFSQCNEPVQCQGHCALAPERSLLTQQSTTPQPYATIAHRIYTCIPFKSSLPSARLQLHSFCPASSWFFFLSSPADPAAKCPASFMRLTLVSHSTFGQN